MTSTKKVEDWKEKILEVETKLTDKMSEYPVISTAIGLGLGLTAGYLIGRLSKCHQDL